MQFSFGDKVRYETKKPLAIVTGFSSDRHGNSMVTVVASGKKRRWRREYVRLVESFGTYKEF